MDKTVEQVVCWLNQKESAPCSTILRTFCKEFCGTPACLKKTEFIENDAYA